MKLQHVAIIPDGNRRWAKARGLTTFKGHEQGMKTIEDIAREAKKQGIKYLTAWGCSRDNVTKRSPGEVRYLYKLFKEHLERMLNDKDLHKDKVRVRVIGEWMKFFPSPLKTVAKKIEEETKNYGNYNFTLLMAYDGKREMAEAFENAQKKGAKIKESNLKNYLWTKDLPPVDLVIRTGGSPHWSSGFLMWHTADSEFYFTKTFWPAFNVKEFRKAIAEYYKALRNHGK
ncbi:di-trans,poly-cis-decaprenylcistransferase [Candidatus Giovannonibacteria bacterium]|nr:di-trans,poly-cis-decaprenylcistransferase [Candidatus Giovannonibacteria bacterium]